MNLTAEEVPDLVPARMVNEFAYCPRLFFLEWVQARFADNEDTAEGRYVHRAVDRPEGRAFGYPLQYSVFVCDLDRREKLAVIERLGGILDHSKDRVAIVDLGDAESRGVECFEFMGRSLPLPQANVVQIV